MVTPQEQSAELPVVSDRPEERRFVVEVGGRVVGFAEYVRRDGEVELTHTVVDDECEGQGVGSALVSGVLDRLRDEGVGVVPTCAFVASYVERHPEYAGLVAER